MALSADLMRRLQVALSLPPQTGIESGGEVAATELDTAVSGGGGVDGVRIANDIFTDFQGDVNTGIEFDSAQAATAFNNNLAYFATTDAPDGNSPVLNFEFNTGSQTFAGAASTGGFFFYSGLVTNAGNIGSSGTFEFVSGDVAGSGNSGGFLFQSGSVNGGTRGTFGVHSDVMTFFDGDQLIFDVANSNDWWGGPALLPSVVVDGQHATVTAEGAFQIGMRDTTLTNPQYSEILIGAWSHNGVVTSGQAGDIEIAAPSISNASSTIKAGTLWLYGGNNAGSGDAGEVQMLGGFKSGMRGWVGCNAGQPVFVGSIGTGDPSTSYPNGSSYYNTSDNTFRVLNGGTWRSVSLT